MYGVHLELLSHDEIFSKLSRPPVIVNDFNVNSEEDKNRLNQLIYTRYEGDALEILPSCDCGHLTGGDVVGEVCEVCGSEVFLITERPLESVLWIRAPDGVRGLINPEVWIILSKNLTLSGCNMLEWLVNHTYKPSGKEPVQLQRLKKYQFKRELNYFIDNFDEILAALEKVKAFTKGRRKEKELLLQFIRENRDKIFSQYIPIPSRLGFITEDSPTGPYADTGMRPAIEAIRTITSINSAVLPTSVAVRQLRAVKAVSQLSDYYYNFISKSLSKKPGWFRKHIFGGRPHFTFRAVISSLSNRHAYDELHLPWSLGVMVFRSHLINRLFLRLNWTPRQALKHLNEHTLRYCPILDEMFQDIIQNHPLGKFPCIFQRNPSLQRGSAQCLYITKIKTDVDINTVSLSVLVLKGPNADYDGDALNGMLCLDMKMHERLSRLEPHHYVLDLKTPWKLSSDIALPSPVLATIANWIHEGEQ